MFSWAAIDVDVVVVRDIWAFLILVSYFLLKVGEVGFDVCCLFVCFVCYAALE
jgi:hypothetical protein